MVKDTIFTDERNQGWSIRGGIDEEFKMAYKSFKEYFQSCPMQRCSSVTTSQLLPSHQRFRSSLSSSLAPGDGEERKPPKTSLKGKIAALERSSYLLGGKDAEPPLSGPPCSPPIHLESEKRIHSEDDSGHGKKRSFLDGSNETDLYSEGAEENEGVGVHEARICTSGASSSRPDFSNQKRKVSAALLPPHSSQRRNSSTDFTISIADDEDENDTQITQQVDLEEVGLDSEAGLGPHPLPEGPFEPLTLWPRDEEGTGLGGELGDADEEQEIIQVPASINSRLLEHQREGVLFLYDLYRRNQGGVLGDDMGLGKTIQTIALLSAVLQGSRRDEPIATTLPTKVHVQKLQRCDKVALILCPTSVVHNWEQEFHSWGEFQVGVCHGLQRESVLARMAAKEVEIVLTSHDTFRIHGAEFCKLQWDCVVVDEAHKLKNEKSLFYTMCLKLPTKRRYGLTGTVMQNKYNELFNVFDWASPGCLGCRDHFREYYAVPIAEGQRISAPQRFVTIAEDRQKHLHTLLKKYLLRRTKEETIGHLMKGKEDWVVFCPMSPLQKRVYRRVLQSPDFQALKTRGLPCSCGSPLKRGECCFRTVPHGVIWPSLHKDNLEEGCDFCPYCLMLPCLTKLRLLSSHLELIKPNRKDDPEKQEKDRAFAKLALGEDADLVGGIEQKQNFLGLSDAQHCGKMAALEWLLESWGRDKVLLFSESVRMLDILEKFLIRKGYSFSRLDGTIPMNSRQALVEDFNHSPSKQIFLISTRAGGLGLNLTSANRVVIFDPSWNPAHDLQAQDRSFRFGQNRHVTVYRLLGGGTLEELVYTRQVYKQQLFNIAMSGAAEKRYFDGVQGSKHHKGELFGVSNLFRDISEDLFAEDIIENHEARKIRMQQMAELEAGPSTGQCNGSNSADEEERVGHGGELCSDAADGCGSAPVAPEQGHEGDNEAERSVQRVVQRVVQNALTKAGVVYSHRNEDVVNLKAPKRGRRVTTQLGKEEGKHVSDEGPGKQRRSGGRQGQKVRPPQAQSKPPRDGKHPSTVDAIEPQKQKVSVEEKRAAFAQMAKVRGMDISEFSQWYLSANTKRPA